MKYFFLIIFSLLFIYSCGDRTPNKKRNEVRTGFDVKVTHSTGDHFEMETDSISYSYLPYIGNLARLKNHTQCELDFLVLAHRIRKNHNLNVVPIAVFEYYEKNLQQKVIIAVPENEDIRAIFVDNYEEFVVKYFGVQQIVENWYRHRLGFGMVKDISWSNELSAFRHIEACIQD